ncbi:MAG: CBS domain-containing protein [Alphaproteobacteria bacterium]|nr:CBS domain-containing protein [Alphaproteobacteria bacterium]
MNVDKVLQSKGDDVAFIKADSTIGQALAMLKSVGVGALVVSDDGETMDGILSERDIVRSLVDHGNSLMDMTVADLMTKSVTACAPDDSIDECMEVMTDNRIRHLPIIVDGRLKGIISIGDVVKARLTELKNEAEALRQYIAM